jgi:hypothetical protein
MCRKRLQGIAGRDEVPAVKPGQPASPKRGSKRGASYQKPASSQKSSSSPEPALAEEPEAGGYRSTPPEATAQYSIEDHPSSTPQGGPASGQISMEVVRQNWSRISTLIRQRSPQTQAFFISCNALGFKDGCLILGTSDFVKARLENSEHTQLVEQVLAEVFEKSIPIRCIVSSGKVGAPADVDSDGIVATALRDLGGEIVDVL